MATYEIGKLAKGDPCLVFFQDGRRPWLCRVVSSYTYKGAEYCALYECMTPRGSSLITGSVWVQPATEIDMAKLLELETLALDEGLDLYLGKLRKDNYADIKASNSY